MMHRPSANELIKPNESYYSLVIAVAKRARQIAEEAEEAGEVMSEKPVQLAVEEFSKGEYHIIEPDLRDDEDDSELLRQDFQAPEMEETETE